MITSEFYRLHKCFGGFSVDEIAKLFPGLYGQPSVSVVPDESAPSSGQKLKIGVVLSGGQAPGGHNVISGLFGEDYLQERAKGSTFYGFKGGPAGIMKCKYVELNADYIQPYRNQGGFDMICSGRDKIETPEQFKQAEETAKKLDLDGLVVIGGDDSNTNACLLAENFRSKNLKTRVIGCPKTIDGDLKCKEVPTSFGFDTACKIYSEMIGNVMIDARSTGKYYHFVRLMGRAASHITLECALQTHPNITIIGEEVAKIETEKMLIQMVETELEKRKQAGAYKGQFMGQSHFFGYEGRCGLPTNFDATYCYALGYGAGVLLNSGKTGLISSVSTPSPLKSAFSLFLMSLLIKTAFDKLVGNLAAPVEEWTVGGTALTALMDVERRHGKFKPVIKKAMVELEGAPFKKFASLREEWALKNRYISPGPPRLGPTRFSAFAGDPNPKQTIKRGKKKRLIPVWYEQRKPKTAIGVIAILGFFFLLNWFMLSRLHEGRVWLRKSFPKNPKWVSAQNDERKRFGKSKRKYNGTYDRMLGLAAQALQQNKLEPKDLWQEPKQQALAWKPCADQRSWSPDDGKNGYIMVTANGGINQQRVAVCNIVVVARLLNAALVIPKFMLSDVWTDASQFGDIYQEEHFTEYLSPDIRIVKELPKKLQSLDLEAIGSVVTDADVMKEAKPEFYTQHILPVLLKNRVIHFVGFGNRLAFDPMPFELQRLRCRCNFHALNFIPRIQETGALLVKRLRNSGPYPAPLDPHLVGPKTASLALDKKSDDPPASSSKYLALHLRFEIDMVAHSLCYFGGGETEQKELASYRQKHFPSLSNLSKTKKFPSPDALRTEGLCPLTPEEAVLMLAALGFSRKTRVFVAGANIYGGSKRLAVLTSLYPNLVTKEKLLTQAELQPFKNFSSQLAALDFIGCAAANAFAMTDSGSQLSSLVSGYRIYYGEGKMPTIRPNKRRLSDILMKNNTIEWSVFEQRVRKAIRQTKHVFARPTGRSVYRYPRCKECMCNDQEY
ncbi:unnamed protein product [Thlaspi arvense]|uniref:O-fucosyltransferase family protein n=1 Tax=Thlaspi arvense TaxID=13288 RepID=A0AAU9RC23_THLAR|nr:unnamed protein product [Thlaspi arvense]